MIRAQANDGANFVAALGKDDRLGCVGRVVGSVLAMVGTCGRAGRQTIAQQSAQSGDYGSIL